MALNFKTTPNCKQIENNQNYVMEKCGKNSPALWNGFKVGNFNGIMTFRKAG